MLFVGFIKMLEVHEGTVGSIAVRYEKVNSDYIRIKKKYDDLYEKHQKIFKECNPHLYKEKK